MRSSLTTCRSRRIREFATSRIGITIRAEQDQALAQFKAAPLDGEALRDVGEHLVLQRLHGVVKALHGVEVAIHDVVEQSVEQVADAEFRGSGLASQ